MKRLPSWIERILKFVSPAELYEQIEGDLIELYNYDISTMGKTKAQISLLVKVIRFIRPGIVFRREIAIQGEAGKR